MNLLDTDTKELATMLSPGVKLNFTFQEGEIMIANDSKSITVIPQIFK